MNHPEPRLASHIKPHQHNGITWLDVKNPAAADLERLQHDYQLHPIHLTESLQKVQHTQVEREAGYLFLILYFPVFDHRTDKVQLGQVGVFLGENYVITIRPSASPILDNMSDQCEQSAGQTLGYFKQGSAHLLYNLIRQLLNNISDMIDIVTTELDDIEDVVFDNNDSDAQKIGKVRQKIVRLRRVIGPQKNVLRDLADQIDSFSGQRMAKYYSNNLKTINRLWEEIEEAKETIEIYKDADFTTSTERTNGILAILTIIFTFTIPITVVGTLYGMNVPLPGGITAGAWTFLGAYTTLEILVVMSLVMAGGMYLYFRLKRWL
ncbi:MAG: magnesium transporter CorA family protein [Candidatus Saccharibacteria bacterium]